MSVNCYKIKRIFLTFQYERSKFYNAKGLLWCKSVYLKCFLCDFNDNFM